MADATIEIIFPNNEKIDILVYNNNHEKHFDYLANGDFALRLVEQQNVVTRELPLPFPDKDK